MKECYYQCEAGCISCRPEDYIYATPLADYVPDYPVSTDVQRSFANLRTATTSRQEKENTMQTLNIVATTARSDTYPTDQRQRDHLVSRLHELKNTKATELRNAFGIGEMPAPRTPLEMVERIKEGKFKIEHIDEIDECEYNEFYYSPWRYIKWVDPTVKEDRPGYEAAEKKLDKLYEDTRDEIVVLDTEKGLAALRQFESTAIN